MKNISILIEAWMTENPNADLYMYVVNTHVYFNIMKLIMINHIDISAILSSGGSLPRDWWPRDWWPGNLVAWRLVALRFGGLEIRGPENWQIREGLADPGEIDGSWRNWQIQDWWIRYWWIQEGFADPGVIGPSGPREIGRIQMDCSN